ncbi:hypothetical protein Tco_0761741, partial [Tanacetum coccineum]
ETINEGIIMAEPNDYISATRKNFVCNDNKGRMVEKSIVEIQGTFLVKLKNSIENFYKLNYDVLVKLEECWWKVNARIENFKQGPYANVKTEKTHDPYLDINHIFCRIYEASNVGDTQENQGHEEHKNNPILETSICKIRRFEMMKYSFNDDEECLAIKESEYLNHSKDSLDAYRELLRIINEGWVMATHDE